MLYVTVVQIHTLYVNWDQVKASVLLICRTPALKADKAAVIVEEDTIVLEICGKWVPFSKTSSLINKTLVIQKTVGGTDGWCFFSCRPVSRKIIEVFVLMRSKMWAWRYQLLGDGCKQTRFYLPGYWKTILCVAKKKQCEGRKDLWAEFRVLWHHFKILNADFIVHTKRHLNWLDDSKPTRQGGSISTIPNSIDFLKKKNLHSSVWIVLLQIHILSLSVISKWIQPGIRRLLEK